MVMMSLNRKNEFVLQQVDLISPHTSLDENQLALVHAVQSGQSFARDLGNRPGNICFLNIWLNRL